MSEFEGQCSNKVRADEKAEEPPYKKLKLRLKANPVTAFTIKGNEEAVAYDEIDEHKRTCPECFTIFPSVKSLHGHMRSHSDRKHRGMVPPEQKKSSRRIKTHSIDDQVVAGCSGSVGSSDLTGVWSREWPSEVRKPSTGDSGTGVARSCSSVNGDEDEEELMFGAAYGLLLLVTGDDRYRSLPSSNKDGIRVNKEPRFDVNINGGYSRSTGKKRKRKSKVSEKVFKEDGCGASLDPSHHAIGNESSCGGVMAVAAARHVCKECDKEFRSGQALGGHMRLHYKPMVANVFAEVAEGVVRCFDLNEIPVDDC